MKRLLALTCWLITVFILTSCSSKDYIITSDYQEKTFDDAVIFIPDVNDSRVFDNLNVFTDQEKTSIEGLLSNTINDHIAEYMLPGSNSTKIYNIKYKTQPQMKEKSFKVGKDLILLDVPQGSIDLGEKEEGNAFILLIEKPLLLINNEEKETSDPAKHYTLSQSYENAGETANVNNSDAISVTEAKIFDTKITLEIKYAVYDNEKNQLAYYGISVYKKSFKKGDDIRSIIKEGIKDISEKIISNSPFKKAE